MQCQCALGYRNGASASSESLCMGPAENGKHPCYPAPCNADWTACSQGLWTISTQRGQRPVCDTVPIRSDGVNYRWGTLKSCQNACLNEPTGLCNIVSRYGQKTDTENGHCWFYACANHNYVWTPQTSWGTEPPRPESTYSSTDITSSNMSTKPGGKPGGSTRRTKKLINKTSETGGSTRRTGSTKPGGDTVDQQDELINKTRWTNKTVNKINWINKTRWETRWTTQTNWINNTRWETRWINKTNWINKTRWTNKTVNKTNWINKTRWETRWETRCVNKTGNALVNADVGTSSGTKPYKGADTSLDSDILYVIGWLVMAMLLLGCCVRCNRKRELPRAAEVIEIQEIPVDE